MQTQVARWGNSLGVRLPRQLAARAGIMEGTRVEIVAEGSRLVISVDRPVYELGELLEGLRPGDLQKAFDWGDEVGREIVE
jgi:antitoxin MazE